MDENDLHRIWGAGAIRVFISHTHPNQAKAARLQTALRRLGIASFVAHNDIELTRQWEVEIIFALQSMHVLAALLTPDFKSSDWTEQEVGAAVGRDIPVFAIDMGLVPYGFMKRYQAIPGAVGERGGATKVANVIAEAIKRNDRLEPHPVNGYIAKLQSAGSYRQTDQLASEWNWNSKLTDQQVQQILAAYNTNNQVSGAGSFDDIILRLMYESTGVQHHIQHVGGRKRQCEPVQDGEASRRPRDR